MFARLSPSTARAGAMIAAAATIAACSDAPPTAAPSAIASQARVATAQDPNDPAAPAGLVTVGTSTFWPYTGDDFTGAPKDPINAIFTGYADPLRIRAALRRLDGNRTAFGLPNVAPFNCTWKDAIGDEQTGYGDAEGWTGSAVQLACGDWSLRFHLRLFAEGSVTLAGVHWDLNVPGTNEHEVISWEVPEYARPNLSNSKLNVLPPPSAKTSKTFVPGWYRQMPWPSRRVPWISRLVVLPVAP